MSRIQLDSLLTLRLAVRASVAGGVRHLSRSSRTGQRCCGFSAGSINQTSVGQIGFCVSGMQ